MTMPDLQPLVITGTARSGTAYMGALMGGLGLRFGHEEIFGPRTRAFESWFGQNGDSSWLAAPFLDQIPEALIVHQVRHPLKVVRSLVGVKFLADRGAAFLTVDDVYTRVKWRTRERLLELGHVEESDKGPRPHKVYRRFVDTYVPEAWSADSLVERSLTYWVRWTEKVLRYREEERYLVHHLELMTPEGIAAILDRIGLQVTPAHIALAMSKLPPDLNTRKVATFDWAEIPDSPLKARAEEIADLLGYVADDPATPPQVAG